jgi:hypothetical protein
LPFAETTGVEPGKFEDSAECVEVEDMTPFTKLKERR